MIPFKDNIPRVHRPVITVSLIVVNMLIFLFELSLSPKAKLAFFHLYGAVPARFYHPEWASVAGYPDMGYWPFLTYMFLHSGWLHVILNMWVLWIFADNIEDVTGHIGFVFFYVTCGVVALVVQILTGHDATQPIIGASGAVAGVMGAYFMLYPRAKVLTFIPIFFLPWIVPLPAPLFLLVWVGIQVFSGLFAHVAGHQGVAWWAHVGGFVAGMVIIKAFVIKGRCYCCYNENSKNYESIDDDFF